ncbi:MAG: YciI family protein [Paraburkholderia sp.]|uniref:YciI family protein n=1 Tax=Paraburkholderia sp. TaxID=1926495 RepID=UPI003C596C46
MHWIVYCTDKPGALALREANTAMHRAYLETRPINLVTSGPLMDDAGEQKIGSFFLVEAQTRDEVETFNRNDPFFALGLWSDIRIHRFNRRVG